MQSSILVVCLCLSQGAEKPAAVQGEKPTVQGAAIQSGVVDASRDLAARIDQITAEHWKSQQITPAPLATDAEFLRRATLDLIGRVPTTSEATTFAADGAPDKRQRLIARLMDSPEFAHHFGTVLDEIIQGRQAGDGAFVDYLRRAVTQRRGWDAIFREIMLGPWESAEAKPAETFLRKRIRSLDDLTTDMTVAFFGVNISCAKCHDHPLVQDWKQRHYYGMASFLHRTGEDKQSKKLTEKASGEVQFVDTKGGRHTAAIMFLTGTVVDPNGAPSASATKPDVKAQDEKAKPREAGKSAPAKAAEKSSKPSEKPASKNFSPRAALVDVALRERGFFSRAIVNRLWASYLGRGLVHPVDQLHSENPPTIPKVLDLLADDLASHQYDLRRLTAAIVQSRVYQQSSRQTAETAPQAEHFARAALRPLSPQQFASSLLLVTGDGRFGASGDAAARLKSRQELDSRARGLTRLLDPPTAEFQSSVGEALYMSNHPAVQELTKPAGNNLTARLSALQSGRELAAAAVRAVYGRDATAEETEYLVRWIDAQPTRERAARDLVWSLLTSAEFRFNH